MKRILFLVAACAAAASVQAQVPMPGWGLSDLIERQSGVVDYTYEKFDFSRFPAARRITEFLWLKDTVTYKPLIFHAGICDAEGEVAQLFFQQALQVVRKESDSVTFVSVDNARLQGALVAYLPLNASDAEVARTADSLQNIRIPSEGIKLLPAGQDDVSYGLQYLFARAGIGTEPLLTWQTYLLADDGRKLIDYCCERVKSMKVGGDIEKFARKAQFEEDAIYVCKGDGTRKRALAFFWCDGKFWAKIGPNQYMSFDSVISVWRHDKKTTHIDAYKLKKRFL